MRSTGFARRLHRITETLSDTAWQGGSSGAGRIQARSSYTLDQSKRKAKPKSSAFGGMWNIRGSA